MPKMKTHRASAKRFSFTGTGKIRSRKSGKSHLLGHKTRKHKRRLKKFDVISPAMERHARRALPYGG